MLIGDLLSLKKFKVKLFLTYIYYAILQMTISDF